MRRPVLATLLAGLSAGLVAFVVPQGTQSRPAPARVATVAFAAPAALPASEPAHPPTSPPPSAPVASRPAPVAPRRPVVHAAPQRAVRAAVRPVVVRRAAAPARVSVVGVGGKWACIISRESGGNPRAVNASSGAGGLFQFLPSSWLAYGGSGLAENASVAEQWRVALAAYARSGWSPWSPYDGC